MNESYSIVVAATDDGYRMSVNGEDYYYFSLLDIQSRIGSLVFPNPQTEAIEIRINYINKRGD